MSYILEALKKLEQKQQREGTPILLSMSLDVPEEKKKNRVLLYVITGALVLNAAVITAWWIAPWPHHEGAAPAAGPMPLQQKEAAAMQNMPAAIVVHAPAIDTPLPQQAASTGAEKSMTAQKPMPVKPLEATIDHSAKGSPPAGRQPEAQPRKETKSMSSGSGAKLLNLGELPPTVRGGLPEFKISGHAYSSESRFRVARVNNKIVQEGESLSQGLKVDEIVPGGVIFTYQGYRFKVGINDNP
jgi:general secretion pathway protein B